MIEFKNVKKAYQDNVVIEDLSFTINDGEFVCIIGPSGCGKTTTLKMINRLHKVNGGEILIDGTNINDIDVNELRKSIGYVIQHIGLFPNMNVKQNISVVPTLLKWSKDKIDLRIKELMKMINMPFDEFAYKYPNELSGGQQQRVGVLRALAANPNIILMDEPFGALDPITRDVLQDELRNIHDQLKKTIIFVTHDMDEAVKMADRILFLDGGKILQYATPEEMLKNPGTPLIREFLGKISYDYNASDLTCEDVMRKRVYTVYNKERTLKCTSIMKQRDVASLVVVDHNNRYLGIIRIEDIKSEGVPGETIEKLIRKEDITVLINSNARDAFSELEKDNKEYLVVLKRDRQVAGIITRSSMAKALASLIWGENDV
ncbi:MAG: ABC transporter ATP-binding protein [Bacilli bacterium]|jgi:osmoprotectant transport system ATP-binding protein|nr:ABC transporter ATP-binding protein [Bacilli bacterium]